MILDKFVKIKIINNNIKKYSKIFNKKLCIGDIIDINVNDLSKGSNIIINVSCDLCGEILKKSYKEYNNNYNRGNIFTCKKCSQKKRKINNINKYGYEHHFQSDKIKNKIKNTNLEKYGVEHVSNIENVKEKKKEFKQSEISKEKIKNSWKNKNVDEINKINKKRKNTTVSKYNVSNISQIDEVKEKKKQTCLDNYGTEYPINNKYIRKLIEETNLKKYGHINPLSNINIKEKIKETNLKKYGKEYYQQTSEFKEKTKETNLKKYGVENIMLSEDYIKNNTIIGSDKNYIKCLGNKIHSLKCDNNKSHNYEIDYDNYNKRKKNNSKICTKCYPIKENASIKEKEVLNFIKSFYKGEIIENYRDGFEIDIYIPGLNIGFEFNGLYWHSDKFSDKNRHINKLNYFKEKNIRIINIWEDDWSYKQNIIKSQIKNWLKYTNHKIYARKCIVKEISNNNDIRKFLDDNHIQGYVKSVKKYGLYYNEVLVSIMTFDKYEGRKILKENEWNLSRFCSILNMNIIGGANKLLKHFIKYNKCNRIISYSDKSWSNGNLYYSLGFNLLNESKISYSYIVNNKRKHKQNFKKQTLIKKYNLNKSLTEKEMMISLGYNRIYDCGQMKFEKLFLY